MKRLKKSKSRRYVRSKTSPSQALVGFVSIIVGVVLLFAVGKQFIVSFSGEKNVLGSSSTLLARGGDDGESEFESSDDDSSNSGSSSSSSGSGSSGSSDSSDSSGSSNSGENESGSSGDSTNSTFNTVGSGTTITEINKKSSIKVEKVKIEDDEGDDNDNNDDKTKKEFISVKRSDSEQKIVLRTGTTKIKIETKDDRFRIKVENEDEDEVENEIEDETELDEDEALSEINDILSEDEIEIERTDDNKIGIKKNEVEAETKFPLSIDLNTNILTVDTPAGKKEVTILPDAAIANAFARRIINEVEKDPETSLSKITLEEENGELTFVIKGFQTSKKFLGFIPMSFDKTVFVSAESGEVLKATEPVFDRIVELLSL